MTSLFTEVQAAYEVLADPQERSWYDTHREDILYGEDAVGEDYCYNTKLTSAEDINKIIMQFSPKMAFTDAPTGFFGGLGDLFGQLAREEALACRWDGYEAVDYPSFGSKNDNHETIRPFYTIWTNFATKKSFAWKDKYRLSEAADRRVRRLMEKENQRIREQALREYNDAVRSLVAFVKKRDPRYRSISQSDAERQKALRDAAATQAARSRAANAAKIQSSGVAEWSKAFEAATDDEIASDESTAEDEQDDVFDCMVCNKTFKSQNQFEAHERSKKHVKALKQLRRSMKQDDDLLHDHHSPPTEATQDEMDELDEAVPVESPDLSFHGDPQEEVSDTSTTPPENNMETGTTSDPEDEDYVPREVLEERLFSSQAPKEDHAGDKLEEVIDDMATATLSDSKNDDTKQPTKPKAKPNKAKQRRAKKESVNDGDTFKCGICAAPFPSKTKLFNHIKDQGHAQLKSVSTDTSNKKSKKRK